MQNLGKTGLQMLSVISVCSQGKVYQPPPLTVLRGGNTSAGDFSDLSMGERFCPSNTWGFQMKSPSWLNQISLWGMDAPQQERRGAPTPQGSRALLLHWRQQELGPEMYWGTQEWVNSEQRFKAKAQHKCTHLFKLKLPITLLFPCIWFFPGRWQEIAGRLRFFSCSEKPQSITLSSDPAVTGKQNDSGLYFQTPQVALTLYLVPPPPSLPPCYKRSGLTFIK